MANSTAKSTLEAKPLSSDASPSRLNLHLPFSGEVRLSDNKKFKETVVIVPFFSAKKGQLSRHIEFLNELGYDVVTFNLKNSIKDTKGTLFSSNLGLGFKHIWADQIEAILNSIAGTKIVFAFSNPSASAIEAIVRRHATDVRGLICDSGPSGDILNSLVNYYEREQPLKFFAFRWAAALATTIAWSPEYNRAIHKDIEALPTSFKILSIRGWKDPIISAQNIDKVFDPHQNVDWQRLSLPQAAHLNGLRDFYDEYAEPVAEFLKSISTPV